MPSADNKRIAKNTLFLYGRMLVVMGVSLYTTRVVLNALGEDNFGIYNIVGGIVVLFTFIQNSLSVAIQRYLSVALGEDNKKKFNEFYSSSFYCNIGISFILILLGETVGLWFLNYKLNIPIESIYSANIVFQLCLVTSIISLLRIPLEAVIISHEKMSFYAYLSIIEAACKLTIAFSISIYTGNRLIFYSILMAILPFCTFLWFYYYSHRILKSKFLFKPNIPNIKSILAFSGWSLLGAIANVGARQGGNIIINIFYGVMVNAAVGIANQVSAAVTSLVGSFQTAFRPQISKSYAQGNKESLNNLVILTSIGSYYILFIFLLPYSINAEYWLKLWLKEVPPYAPSFSILILIYSLIDAAQSPFIFYIYARGNIRNYQLWLGSLIILNIPLSYLFLRIGYSPVCVFIIYVSINFISAIIRLWYIKHIENFPTLFYIKKIVSRMILVTLLTVSLGLIIKSYFSNLQFNFIYSSILIFITCIIIIYLIGLPYNYKFIIKNILLKFLKRKQPV